MVFSPRPEDSIGLVLEHVVIFCLRWRDYLIEKFAGAPEQ
jgi:hypothetical protein